jgi:hypothetical protein
MLGLMRATGMHTVKKVENNPDNFVDLYRGGFMDMDAHLIDHPTPLDAVKYLQFRFESAVTRAKIDQVPEAWRAVAQAITLRDLSDLLRSHPRRSGYASDSSTLLNTLHNVTLDIALENQQWDDDLHLPRAMLLDGSGARVGFGGKRHLYDGSIASRITPDGLLRMIAVAACRPQRRSWRCPMPPKRT